MSEANSHLTDPPRPRAWNARVAAMVAVVLVAAAATAAVIGRAGGGGAPNGPVLFDAALAEGLGSYTAGDGHTVHPERVAIVDDPLGLPRKVARFTVYDRDVGPTRNPRAMLATPPDLAGGQDYWLGWSTLFPTHGFPRSVPGWLTFEAVYGPPGRGAGPRHLQVEGSRIVWRRNATYRYDAPWHMPLLRDRWIDFVVHQRQSRRGRVGFVELWVNTGSGWEQQRMKGRLRLHTRTIDRSNRAGPNWHALGLYRKRGMFRVVTLYHAAHRVGTSFAAVDPHTYG